MREHRTSNQRSGDRASIGSLLRSLPKEQGSPTLRRAVIERARERGQAVPGAAFGRLLRSSSLWFGGIEQSIQTFRYDQAGRRW